MSDLISRQALCEYALNQKDKSVTPNDIMRFPSAQPETHDKRTKTHSCDCINRQDAIDYCYQLINVEHQQGSDEMNYGQERVNQTETILHHLELMSSAQPDLDDVYAHAETEAEARFHAEIVRCKDCKHWLPHTQFGYDEDNDVYYDYCAKLIPEDEYYAFQREANDYCSRAERRTDE